LPLMEGLFPVVGSDRFFFVDCALPGVPLQRALTQASRQGLERPLRSLAASGLRPRLVLRPVVLISFADQLIAPFFATLAR